MPIKRKATDSGRSSRASKRPTPVPDIGSSDEYSDYEEEVKDDNLKGSVEVESRSYGVCLLTSSACKVSWRNSLSNLLATRRAPPYRDRTPISVTRTFPRYR